MEKNSLKLKASKKPHDIVAPLLGPFSDLRVLLERMDAPNLSDKCVDVINTIQAHCRLMEMDTVVTITGPQGVGKSSLANQLFEIPTDAHLPVTAGRGEKAVVLVKAVSSKEIQQGPVLEKTTPRSASAQSPGNMTTIYWESKPISYSEARDSLIDKDKTYSQEKTFYDWFIPRIDRKWKYKKMSLPIEEMLSLLVLPGIETNAPWSEFAKEALLVSDVIIFCIDTVRSAQNTSKIIREYVQELKFLPIIVLSKADTMGDKEIAEFKKELVKEWGEDKYIIPVGADGSGIQDLKSAIIDTLTKTSSDNKNLALRTKRYLREQKIFLSEAEKLIREDALPTKNYFLIDEWVRKFEEASKIIEGDILEKTEQILNEHFAAVREHDKSIKGIMLPDDDILSVVENFLVGLSPERMREAGKTMNSLWAKGLESKISDAFNSAYSKAIKEFNLSLAVKEKQQEAEWGVPYLSGVLTSMVCATNQEDVTGSIAKLNNVLVESGKLSQEILGQIETIKKVQNPGGKNAKQITAGGGAAYIVGEISEKLGVSVFGGAFVGEVMVGVTLVVLTIAGIRNFRDTSFTCYNLIDETYKKYYEKTYAYIEKNLRRRLDKYQYCFKEMLSEKMGLNDSLRNMTLLKIALKDARDSLNLAIDKLDS